MFREQAIEEISGDVQRMQVHEIGDFGWERAREVIACNGDIDEVGKSAYSYKRGLNIFIQEISRLTIAFEELHMMIAQAQGWA